MATLPGAAFTQNSRDPRARPLGDSGCGATAGARPAAGVGGCAGRPQGPAPHLLPAQALRQVWGIVCVSFCNPLGC